MKKKISKLLTMVMACSMLFGSFAGTASASDDDTIKLGIFANYSSVSIGYFVPGAYYAVDQINEAGGIDGKQVEIVYRDSNGDSSNIVQKLTELKDEGVVAIIGPDSDSMAPACAQWAEENQVVMITPSVLSTDVALESHSDYFFTCHLSAWAAVNAYAKDIEDKGYEKYVVVGQDGGASTDVINLAALTLPEEQTSSVQVSADSSDFSSVVMSLMGDDPDFTISILSATTWTSYFEQAQLMGMYDEIFDYDFDFLEDLYVSSLGEDYPAGHIRGVISWDLTDQDTEEKQEMTQGFVDAAKEYLDQDVTPGSLMMEWYIGAESVIQALQDIGSDCTSEELIEALENVEFSTPWLDYVGYRALDHCLVIPYKFGTAVWADEDSLSLTLDDVIIYDAEDLLPSYEDYKEYAESNGIPFDWVEE